MRKAKKSFGQHFLRDASVVKKILSAADIRRGETVLEIGPGGGVLTRALADAGARVVAVEADRDLADALAERFGADIELISGDILKRFPSAPPAREPYKLVANLPYNIASEVIERFLKHPPRPSRMVVMVQREVADRMLAAPPDMSVLSVAVQLYADASRVCTVPPGAFAPPPKVDSTVVRLDANGADPARIEPVIALAKAGFSSRRKQLHRNLADAGIAESAVVKAHLAEMGLPEDARAQALKPDQWSDLWKGLEE